MAFLQQAPPRQPIFRVSGVVVWLLAGLSAAHAARVFVFANSADRIINDYAFIPARYSPVFLAAHHVDPGSWLERAVPFVSYMALHENLTHLAVNSLWLLAFGPVVARRFGSGLFLLFFLVCGVLAAATHLACNWASPMPVIGASGAISGLMAAGIRILPTTVPRAGTDRLAPMLSRQVVVFSLLWVAVNVLTGFTGFGMGGVEGLVAWQAHLGGYFAGLLLSGPFDALRPRNAAPQLVP